MAERRDSKSPEPSGVMRCASTRADSRYVTSFIRSKACRGVLVRTSRTVQASRPAESTSIIPGRGAARAPALPECVQTAAIQILSLVLLVVLSRKFLPQPGRLIRLHRWSTDLL